MPKRIRAWLKNIANPTTEAAIVSDSGADASRASDVEHSQDRAGTVGGVASASNQRVVAGSDGASEAGTGHMRISNAGNLAKGVGTTLLDLTEVVSDVFPPLKSAAAGMNFLRKLAKNTRGNKKDAKRLLKRIEAIERSWTTTNDTHALHCRSVLTEELDAKRKKLKEIVQEKITQRTFTASDTKEVIEGYIRDVEQALNDYERSLVENIHRLQVEQINYDERDSLDKLPRAKDAGFNASGSDTRSHCLEDTRVDILRELMEWADSSSAKQVYWLNGHAGSGKSTIAQSFAEQLADNGRLGASFFCSRSSAHASDRTMIFPTIAFHLATSSNDASLKFRKAVLDALEKNQDIASLALHNQFQELIIRPADESGIETVVVIDALDECRDDEATSIILSYLAQFIARIPKIKFFITSRPETNIRMGFRLKGLRPITDVMVLHKVGATSVDKDIRRFLEVKLNDSEARAGRSDLHLPNDWPSKSDVENLVAKSGGLFIFAATAVKLIFDEVSNPQDQLNALLSQKDRFVKEGSSGLDILYLDVLSRAFSKKDDDFMQRIRSILGFLVVACDLVSTSTMADILGLNSATIQTSLRSLHSVLLVPEDSTLPIRFFHKSFPDFLSDSTRCTNPRFYIDRDAHHFKAATRCFGTMEGGLKKNICGLPRYAMNDEVALATLDRCISEALRYSCRYWAAHLLSDGNREAHLLSDTDYENEQSGKPCVLHRFLTTRQLQWFEVLGLLRDLRTAVNSLTDVHEWLASCGDKYKTIIDWTDAGRRFILNAFDIVDASVAHIYHSALPFTSDESLLKSYHATDLACEAAVLIGGQKAQQGGPIRTLAMPVYVSTLEYSPDGTMIAAGGAHFSCLFRSATGEQLAKSEHDNDVISLSFSHNSQTLATATSGSIMLWDARTGVRTITLDCKDRFGLKSVAFYPYPNCGELLASSSADGRVCLYNVDFGDDSCQQQFTVEMKEVILCWLRRPGHKIVIIGTELWEVDPPGQVKVLQPYEPESREYVIAVASSFDGSLVALGSFSGRLVIYNVETGDSVYNIQTTNLVHSTQFSPTVTPRMLAFAVWGSTAMHVWYPEGSAVSMHEAHGSGVTSVTFSPDGRFIASGAYDNTVNIWETAVGASNQDKDGNHSKGVNCMHFSNDGQLLVSGFQDQSMQVWDTRNGTIQSILRDHPNHIIDAAFTFNNRYVIFCDTSGYGHLWDRAQGEIMAQQRITMHHGREGSSRILPYTHGLLGFIHCAESGYPLIRTGRIGCWTVDQIDGAEPRMVLVAQGDISFLDEHVVRISHREQAKADDDITLVLECSSGKQYSAIWRNSRAVTDTTEMLHFVEEAGESSSLIGVHGAFTTSETPCYRSDDGKWVLDRRQGRRILWVPPIHRGVPLGPEGCWHGKRLTLAGGRLLLVDFSSAKSDDNPS